MQEWRRGRQGENAGGPLCPRCGQLARFLCASCLLWFCQGHFLALQVRNPQHACRTVRLPLARVAAPNRRASPVRPGAARRAPR